LLLWLLIVVVVVVVAVVVLLCLVLRFVRTNNFEEFSNFVVVLNFCGFRRFLLS